MNERARDGGVEKIKIKIEFYFSGADSLAYLSVEGLERAVKLNMKVAEPEKAGHCTACLTGDYPGGIPEELSW